MKVSSPEGFHKGEESAAAKAASQGMDALAERRAQQKAAEIAGETSDSSERSQLKAGTEALIKAGQAGKAPEQKGGGPLGQLLGDPDQQQAGQPGRPGEGDGIAQELAKLEGDGMRASEAMILSAVQKEERKDLAQLSQESKNTRQVKEWDSHAEAAAWQDLLKWLPSDKAGLQLQIKELSQIYMHMLNEILLNVPADSQQIYTDKLRQILICQIDALLKASVPCLNSFFSACGTPNSICRLEKSLFFTVTGTHLSLEAVKRDWSEASRQGRAYIRQGSGAGFHFHNSGGSGGSFFFADTDTGTGRSLYSRSGTAERASVSAQGRTEELLRAARILHQKGQTVCGGENTYTLRDMERGEQFVKTIGGASSNLFSDRHFTAKNEALCGVLWTIEKCKTQMFIQREADVSPVMKKEVESAVEQMTANYIQTAVRKAHERGFEAFSRRQAYEIYRYAMKQYYSGVKINKAIRDGFYYALKYFLQKTGAAEQESGQWEHGFFQENTEKASIKKELERGSRHLEEDWKRFLSEMDYDDEMLQLAAGVYSPWAMFLEPEKEKDEGTKKKGEAFAIAGALAAAAFLVVLGIIFL